MIQVFIQGISDGIHDIELKYPVEEVPDLAKEFFGIISIIGKLRKLGKRYTIDFKISCNANLICDISLKEFVEIISSELKLSFISNNEQFQFNKNKELEQKPKNNDNLEILIPEDLKNIDITIEVREELELNIPMKKLAPDLVGKEFKDIYPEYTSIDKDKIDDRWEILKSIKTN